MKKELKKFRKYKRRPVTRTSGYKASGETTGGECIIHNSESYTLENETAYIKYAIPSIEPIGLFEIDQAILAFSAYINPTEPLSINLQLSYKFNEHTIVEEKKYEAKKINENSWNGIGLHIFQSINPTMNHHFEDVSLVIKISGSKGTRFSLASIHVNSVNHKDYLSNDLYKPFNQKTAMHVPHIYYFPSQTLAEKEKIGTPSLKDLTRNDKYSIPIVLKSCNRCTIYSPINVTTQKPALAFSLHCASKKCVHSTFSAYSIQNTSLDQIRNLNILKNVIEDNKIISTHGHQLECRACKKFYVNSPLNPQRNPQQFKEDGLRRRALELLVNNLLDLELVHHEFEFKNNKEFTEYIWEKFGKKCFKCSKKLKINEMHLDHTMPLAYLYRLDEGATCLCPEDNLKKSDKFPVDFYTEKELEELSEITNIDLEVLKSKEPNMQVVNLLVKNIVWFFDVFLMQKDYQKIRDGRKTSDKIYASLERILQNTNINLLEEYQDKKGENPTSITLK